MFVQLYSRNLETFQVTKFVSHQVDIPTGSYELIPRTCGATARDEVERRQIQQILELDNEELQIEEVESVLESSDDDRDATGVVSPDDFTFNTHLTSLHSYLGEKTKPEASHPFYSLSTLTKEHHRRFTAPPPYRWPTLREMSLLAPRLTAFKGQGFKTQKKIGRRRPSTAFEVDSNDEEALSGAATTVVRVNDGGTMEVL
ncbi:hypothetical protein J1N35_025850 [Gossypium stocksii]|uniref:Uncharacterized protein n=1 Tax=Gossypium stocksii TaxID=47602 RepID=A0A9D3V755_9ROSI|nr:hypothetical protein J1N35_025850 [Gossypium stocksii]